MTIATAQLSQIDPLFRGLGSGSSTMAMKIAMNKKVMPHRNTLILEQQ